MHYLVLFAIVLAVGLIPAFGPPSWIFAVFFYHKYHLAFLTVVFITALATTLGRVLLAYVTRIARNYLPNLFISNLTYAQHQLESRRNSVLVLVGLFVLSPLPSAQMFEAAGLLETNLLVLGTAFFFGRLVSLSIYLSISRVAEPSIHKAWEAGFTSLWAFITEVLCILAIIGLLNFRWVMRKFRKMRS